MTRKFSIRRELRTRHQAGVVLIVALIFVLLLSIVGIAAIRGSGLQEAMTSNMRDRSIAFSSAEAGLRVAEGTDLGGLTLEKSFDGSEAGYYADLNAAADSPESWDSSAWSTRSVLISSHLIGNAVEQARYVIEYVPTEIHPGETGGARDEEATRSLEDLQVYRITSRGVGMTTNSEVILQSTFVR